MSTAPIRPNEEFQCPLCQVTNRADAKFCRRCGISREILSGYASGAGRRDPSKPREITPESTVDLPVVGGVALPGSVPAAQGHVPAAQGNVPAAPGHVSAAPGHVSAAPGQVPAAQGRVPTAQGHPNNQDTATMRVPVGLPSGADSAKPASYVNPECAGCASVVRSSDRFCCWCGEVQPARPKPVLKICRDCSQSLPGRANYCFECGRPVGTPEKLRMRIPTELFGEESSEFFPTFDA